jgi:hypothetical protein
MPGFSPTETAQQTKTVTQPLHVTKDSDADAETTDSGAFDQMPKSATRTPKIATDAGATSGQINATIVDNSEPTKKN